METFDTIYGQPVSVRSGDENFCYNTPYVQVVKLGQLYQVRYFIEHEQLVFPLSPDTITREVAETKIGLRVYHRDGAWVVSHTFPVDGADSLEAEWTENTITIGDDDTVTIVRGYLSGKPQSLWPHFLRLAFAVWGFSITVSVISIYWFRNSLNARMADSVIVATAVIAVTGLVALGLYLVNPQKDLGSPEK